MADRGVGSCVCLRMRLPVPLVFAFAFAFAFAFVFAACAATDPAIDGPSAPLPDDRADDGIDADGDGLDCEATDVAGRRLVVCLDDVNRPHAAKLCQRAGYRLAVVADATTQSAIEALLERAGALYTDAPWIAGDLAGATRAPFQRFYQGEPSGDGDCLHMNWPLGMGTWNDAGCHQHEAWSSFVCEGAGTQLAE